ncbi:MULTISPECIES: DUF1294 domain-containing protein [unclassified Lentimonas]|uniref:DUF1294 domain-containing protein n=1 Tax=unclassified Lentimonas TaxID=2630993 RepID=UPI001322F908|nr:MULTISPECIES: DUF1294 domain-containing protein [unclassified Lentimonas]CAA6680255.1 Unannotated [Lentimonas sp. CC4]CAA6683757.1 Unannotated [Lentimonas sp. CC6]CAA7074395.1 Unannotated [Lentimonas sp. CC4]CAA7169005.1 Unannotated [Lentimonas sp. CC21]CAA7180588.1 Unannotated [Lentimonas sp. CC8]
MNTHRLISVLLILPILALFKSARWVQPKFMLGYLVLISLITCYTYWHDKRRAQIGGRRVSEATLHTLECLGGWPAAYYAQQKFRHKTIKRNYQTIFWCIVGLYQYLSLEMLFQWRVLHTFVALFR